MALATRSSASSWSSSSRRAWRAPCSSQPVRPATSSASRGVAQVDRGFVRAHQGEGSLVAGRLGVTGRTGALITNSGTTTALLGQSAYADFSGQAPSSDEPDRPYSGTVTRGGRTAPSTSTGSSSGPKERGRVDRDARRRPFEHGLQDRRGLRRQLGQRCGCGAAGCPGRPGRSCRDRSARPRR